MEMKNFLILLLLSVSVSLGSALDAPLQEDVAMTSWFHHLHYRPQVPVSQACSSAWKTCFVHKGFPPYSSECCDAVRNVGPKCFGPLGFVYPKVIFACKSHLLPPSPPAPPVSSSKCPFVEACNVKSRGFWPTYNISNPDCCKIVTATLLPKGKCYIGYTPLFFKLKHVCYSQRPPKSPSRPPPKVPPTPLTSPPAPPQASNPVPVKPIPPTPQAPSTPPPVKPVQPPPQVPSTPLPVKPVQPPQKVPSTPPPIQPPSAVPRLFPPTSSPSCAFVAACNVKVIGSAYSYSLTTQDSLLTCCRVVRGTHGNLGPACSQEIYSRALDDLGKFCYTVPPVKS